MKPSIFLFVTLPLLLLVIAGASRAAIVPMDSGARAIESTPSAFPRQGQAAPLAGLPDQGCEGKVDFVESVARLGNRRGQHRGGSSVLGTGSKRAGNATKCAAGDSAQIPARDRQNLAPFYALVGGLTLAAGTSATPLLLAPPSVGLPGNSISGGVNVSAVPLPPAATLFAGSLIALSTVARRRRTAPE